MEYDDDKQNTSIWQNIKEAIGNNVAAFTNKMI